ncbi:MAG: hypothetical protein IPP97_10515 [Candidatus Obscuribacter sp.]|nr:hypothetical protein [Candidatus Obscuribacter sp.]MDQ5966089.1 hypothetical protein [Cyanobacteriota bacterium erpe_2018_sw_39hr_WHONDRS-SW48-000098_B_bin.30]MBK7839833.1 hypothetical protein [Candidatus Obscuribacter sp.]MBK9202093.1 hypothetical protein [Candidatus Obscuribacter sp.]MBK9620477.1 hypothetical protein [Candidatus Obscuribacter sp.]
MFTIATKLTEVETAFEDSKEVRWLTENEVKQLIERLVTIAASENEKREAALLSRLDYPAR